MKQNQACKVKHTVGIVLTVLLLFSCQPVPLERQEPDTTPPPAQEIEPPVNDETPQSALRFENDSVTATTDIHYTGEYCNECHEKTPVVGGDRYLKWSGDYTQLCRCHTEEPTPFLHPFDVKPSAEKEKRMPADFPLENGKLTCDTCHDLYLQCQKRLFDKNSLRGAPYSKRTDFCFKCHEEKKYEGFDPHNQLTDAGEIIIEKCLYCHEEKPDEKHATFKEVKFIGDIEVLCRRCHLIAGNHSGNFDHMGIVPSEKRMNIMKEMEKKYNILLPLDDDGKMTCITCHNPHEKGVIPDPRPGGQGAGSTYRHRLPGKLCKECHEF